MLEVDVVHGYVASKKAKPGSIQLHYSYKQKPPSFGEQTEPSKAKLFARPAIYQYDD
jgi:hypothetical protein